MHAALERPLVRVIRAATWVVRALTRAVEARKEGIDPMDSKAPPKTTMLDGSPVTDDHREIGSDGMQKGYVVLSAEERAKGYVRPLRQRYIHDPCGVVTTMSLPIAETYARDPKFYGETFCAQCREHFPVADFVWDGTDERVGS